MTDCKSAFYVEKILNYYDRSDRVLSMMKTRHDNYMNDYISVEYAKKDTELSWPIRLGVIHDEN